MKQKNHLLTGVIVVTLAVGVSLSKSWLSRVQVARNSYPVTLVLKNAYGLRGSETIEIAGVPLEPGRATALLAPGAQIQERVYE